MLTTLTLKYKSNQCLATPNKTSGQTPPLLAAASTVQQAISIIWSDCSLH